MMKEGQEGCWGRIEERILASGVVWKEAPESAIHSVLTGGVRPMALKDCANRGAAPALAAPVAIGCPLKALAANGAAAVGIPNAGHALAREAVARAESLGATACAARAAGATAYAAAREAAARAACAAGATAATKAAAAARSAGATA